MIILYLLLISLSPSLALLLYFYHKDKYEKEPLDLLLKAFLAGLVIYFFAFIIESIFLNIINFLIVNYLIKIFFISFLVAGPIEEGFKILAFRFLIYKNKEFNEPYDGIIYAVMISLGLASLENIVYVVSSYSFLNITSANIIAFLRAIFAVPAHAFFSVVSGFYLSLAKFSKDYKSQYIYKGVIFPILLHGLYDFFVFTFIFSIIFLIILFILSLRFTLKAIKIHIENSPFKTKNSK